MNGIQPVLQPRQYASEEEIRNCLKCEVLEANRQILATNLIPDRHMDFLRSKYVLSEEDCEEISYPPTRKRRASKFLDIIQKKGAEAYDALCLALREEGTQTFLLQQLNQDFERRLNRYRELVGPPNTVPGLRPISPPPLQPPPPPSQLHRDNRLSPMEQVFQGGTTPPISPSSSSCPGYLTSSSGLSFVTSAMDLTKQDGQSMENTVSSLQKPRLNVADYLQSLNIRENDQSVISAPAYSGSVSASSHHEPGLPVTVSVPAEDSQSQEVPGDHRIRHQRLSSRGSLQDMSLSPGIPAAGDSLSPPFFSTSIPGRSPPVEHSDNSLEPSPYEEGSFFESVPGGSLVPSPQAYTHLLCDAAIRDQNEALNKCVYTDSEPDKEREEDSGDAKPSDISLATMSSPVKAGSSVLLQQLLCLSPDHKTDIKTIANSSSSPPPSLSSSQRNTPGSSSHPTQPKQQELFSNPGDVPTEFGSNNEHSASGADDGFQVMEGISEENRRSVHNKAGQGLRSTQC